MDRPPLEDYLNLCGKATKAPWEFGFFDIPFPALEGTFGVYEGPNQHAVAWLNFTQGKYELEEANGKMIAASREGWVATIEYALELERRLDETSRDS